MCGASIGRGNESLFQASGSHDYQIYGKNSSKIFSKSSGTIFHTTWYVASGTSVHHSLCVQRKTLGWFLPIFGKVKGNLGFLYEKVETLDLSESIPVCDLTVGN